MPTGFSLGPFTIHYYGIVIILGILIAMFIVKKEVNSTSRRERIFKTGILQNEVFTSYEYLKNLRKS